MGKGASGVGPTPRVAVIGSGPSGCYAAQFTRKSWPGAEITVFERLPVPYGLIRYGVAPDHQGTKAVQQQFERLFTRDAVLFIGNVEIGKDIPLKEIRAAFDVVIVATGLSGDRKLTVPGFELNGIFGAGQVTRVLNEHPDEPHEGVSIGKKVVVIGNGNVAIDVVRLLIKPDSGFEGSDINLSTRQQILTQPIETIDILGRSPAHDAKFDATMISELARTPGIRFAVTRLLGDAPPDDPLVRALRELVSSSGTDVRSGCDGTVVTFHFGWTPDRALGDGRVQELVARSTTATETDWTLQTDTIITAIGFEEHPERDLSLATLIEEDADLEAGRLASGLYGVGWCIDGPRGNIPRNRLKSRATVQTILEDVSSGRLQTSKPGRNSLSSHGFSRATDYLGWKRIDKFETETALSPSVRRKIKHVSEMLEVAGRGVRKLN